MWPFPDPTPTSDVAQRVGRNALPRFRVYGAAEEPAAPETPAPAGVTPRITMGLFGPQITPGGPSMSRQVGDQAVGDTRRLVGEGQYGAAFGRALRGVADVGSNQVAEVLGIPQAVSGASRLAQIGGSVLAGIPSAVSEFVSPGSNPSPSPAVTPTQARPEAGVAPPSLPAAQAQAQAQAQARPAAAPVGREGGIYGGFTREQVVAQLPVDAPNRVVNAVLGQMSQRQDPRDLRNPPREITAMESFQRRIDQYAANQEAALRDAVASGRMPAGQFNTEMRNLYTSFAEMMSRSQNPMNNAMAPLLRGQD